MALPFSRDFDAVDAGPLPFTTVNALQDGEINKRHGNVPFVMPASLGVPETGAWTESGLFVAAPGAAAQWDLGFGPMVELSRITDLDFGYRRVGGTITLELHVVDMTAGPPFTDTTFVLFTDAVSVIDTLANFAMGPNIMVAGSYFYFRFISGAAGDRFYALAAYTDK